MEKADTIIIACACVALAAVGVLSGLSQYRNRDKKQEAAAAVSQVSSMACVAEASRTSEASRIAGEDFYQKLREGRPVTLLLIGDDIGGSAGASAQNGWVDRLINQLHNTYGSTFTVKKPAQTATNTIKGWIEYDRMRQVDSQVGTASAYDAVLICTGQYDQTQVDLREFHMFYEDLIARLIRDIPKAAIFPVIEGSIKTENGYTVDIRDLASHYGLNIVDMKEAFGKSGKSAAELSKDGVHPTDTGYALYADTIFRVISGNVTAQKAAGATAEPVYFTDSAQIARYRLITQCQNSSGFQLQRDATYASVKKGDTLSFSASGSIIYVYYTGSVGGGSFQIYVDGRYEGEVSTKGSGSVPYLVSDRLTAGTHTIQLVTKQGPIYIVGVVGE